MFRGIASVTLAVSCLVSIANAQMLIPLYGACSSSVQCVGVAICFNHVCQCPPVYNAVGITCVYAGIEGEMGQPPAAIVPGPPPPPSFPPVPMPMGPPFPMGFQPPQPMPGPMPPMPGGAPFAYPGLPCAAGRSCMGNSVCVQGTCGCPAGQVVAGYSCVASQRVLPGPGPMPAGPYAPMPRPYPMPGEDDLDFLFGGRGFPPPGAPQPGYPIGGSFGGPGPLPMPMPPTCPPAQVPLGPDCFAPAAIVNYPAPIPCQPAAPAPCMGGSVCMGAVCACPPPFVWAGSGCAPPPAPAPPPPPPPPPPPMPYASYPMAPAVIVDKTFIPGPYAGPFPMAAPAPFPMAAPAPFPMRPAPMPYGGPGPGPLALGSACNAHNQCVVGAFCQLGVCQCRPAFLPYGSICVLRRRAKDETERSHTEKVEEKKKSKKKKNH